MAGGALSKIYNGLEVKCTKCPKVVSLSDLDRHEENCGKPKCWNEQICLNYENKQMKGLSKPCCSQKCELLLKILETNKNPTKIWKIVSDFKPS